MFKLYIECPQADCFGEREFPLINREFKEMGPQAVCFFVNSNYHK